MISPRISVIMSVYNEPIEWLHLSIDSILKQTFIDYEFIIINDNPDNLDTISLLKEYANKDHRVSLVFNEENIGLTKSLNKGLFIARGEYIARMDADDISLPERFQKQIDYMDSHPDLIVLGTNIKFIGDRSVFETNSWIRTNDIEIKARLLINSCFAHPTVMIRKKVLDSNNITYDENYRQAQDYRLWEILKDYGLFSNLPEPLLEYRVSASQVSKKHNSKSNNNATSIRKRLIMEVLKRCDINPEDYFGSDIIKARNIIDNKSFLIGKANLISLKKNLYFSTDKKKIYVLFKSLLNGDFFELNFFEKVYFFRIIIGQTPAVAID